MNRWLLAAGALVVMLAGAGLLWQLRSGGGTGGAGEREPAAAPRDHGAAPTAMTGRVGLPPVTPRTSDETPELALPDPAAPPPPRPRGDDPLRVGSAADEYAEEQAMADVERQYAQGDHEAARVGAHLVLDKRPGDPRMLSIVVMSACALDLAKEADQYFQKLSGRDRRRVAASCREHGIELE